MRKIYAIAGITLSILCMLVLIYSWWRFRDRHPGYTVDITTKVDPRESLHAGFGKASINPAYFETWTDVDGDARFDPEQGDFFADSNGNGRFDAVWIAGFHNRRPAQGVHDTLWARAMILQQGAFKLGLCVLDVIGFGADEIISVRKALEPKLDLDYLIIASTHTHQGPDLIGMWGDSEFRSGVDATYLDLVRQRCQEAIIDADASLRPTLVTYAEDPTGSAYLVEDSRRPIVLDPALRVLHFTDSADGGSLGTLIGWSNHPETLWSDNLQLSSDFPHYLRTFTERGIPRADTIQEGLGGMSIFLNGAIGGLMTTSPRLPIPGFISDTIYFEPTFAKTRAQGAHLASSVIDLVERADTLQQHGISLVARSINLPMDNKLFRLGAWLGVLDRGLVSWFALRSEIAYWQLGHVGFLHVPGEIYPEIINGGIEAPPGRDFDIDPVEIPPLRSLVPASHCFVVGLSNDMIGYIIPKSEWDEHPPHLYHEHDAPYGEINSLGPETGPLLHTAIARLLTDLPE